MANTQVKSTGSLVIMDHGLKGYKVQIRGGNGLPTYSTVQGLDTPANVIKNITSAANAFGGSLKKTKIKDATRKQLFVERGLAVPYRFRKDGGIQKPTAKPKKYQYMLVKNY